MMRVDELESILRAFSARVYCAMKLDQLSKKKKKSVVEANIANCNEPPCLFSFTLKLILGQKYLKFLSNKKDMPNTAAY